MKRVLALCVVLSSMGGMSFAGNYEGCDKDKVRMLNAAMRNAKDLTLRAATAVGDNREFDRWFGTYSPRNAETVRANLKAVVSAIRSGGVTAQCDEVGFDGCDPGIYAWVYAGEPFLMHICPSFFSLPSLVALQPGTRRSDNGTREGTIVHELTHFQRVAGTEDHCYSRIDCAEMAQDDPRRAVDNADSYQYFTEDVTYYARQPVSGKPAVADRAN